MRRPGWTSRPNGLCTEQEDAQSTKTAAHVSLPGNYPTASGEVCVLNTRCKQRVATRCETWGIENGDAIPQSLTQRWLLTCSKSAMRGHTVRQYFQQRAYCISKETKSTHREIHQQDKKLSKIDRMKFGLDPLDQWGPDKLIEAFAPNNLSLRLQAVTNAPPGSQPFHCQTSLISKPGPSSLRWLNKTQLDLGHHVLYLTGHLRMDQRSLPPWPWRWSGTGPNHMSPVPYCQVVSRQLTRREFGES